jgi:hypothetical protein
MRLWKAYNEYGQQWSKIAIERFHTMRSEQQIKNSWKSTVFRKFITDGFDDCKDSQTAVNVDSWGNQDKKLNAKAVRLPKYGNYIHLLNQRLKLAGI